MKLMLRALRLSLLRGEETIPLSGFSYFYGQMGAGKTSIARLIDYCLGGDLHLSPALQSEFTAATLEVEVDGTLCTLERQRDSHRVRASWQEDGMVDVVLPARKAEGVVLRGTEVEVVSDLIFHLAGMRPPRVRRSKEREDSELSRLSLRDLLWYCYLDQDEIDSSFFHLDAGADPFKRNKSRDVMRFVLGFHQERVAELESSLEETRLQRAAAISGASALAAVLDEVGVRSEEEIEGRINALEQELAEAAGRIAHQRTAAADTFQTHATDSLRQAARLLAEELTSIEDAMAAIERALSSDIRHRNEVEGLLLKVWRSTDARAVLGGVEFVRCPRCTNELPERATYVCHLCGQEEPALAMASEAPDAVAQDARARILELGESIARHEEQLKRARSAYEETASSKGRVDRQLSNALSEYDSLYLSGVLAQERRHAAIQEQIAQLAQLRRLPEAVTRQQQEAAALVGAEMELRYQLVEARKRAEADTSSLDRLGELFLDCMLRAQLPGIAQDDRVVISPRNFLPEVQTASMADVAVTSFTNISSGGKKTLFKCCFALALHRLAAETNAALPRVLIIDSPMKNISERENRRQFEGFHELLYELKAGELADTQFVLIDKEYLAPANAYVEVVARHMTPTNDEFPPLIPYYRGH